MLISPPFLPPRGNQSEEQWLDNAMPVREPGQGAFPVSYRLEWHGGVHITAPVGANGAPLPARAIADGTIALVRRRTDPVPASSALNYGAGYTSDGVVVVRHETEIGATANGQATQVVFYSVYMHLHSVKAGLAVGNAISRKAEIGQAGHIYGVPNVMHFEICCDDANLARLVGRPSGDVNVISDGRTDALFGEMYFHLPASTPVFGTKPLPQYTQAMMQPPKPAATHAHPHPVAPAPVVLTAAHTTTSAYIVGIRYAGGEGAAAQSADALVSTYDLTGAAIGTPRREAEAEYHLYPDAKTISAAFPAGSRPAVAAVYEMLRFGRVTGPDTLAPADVPHWREVNYPGGQGWVNLNANDVHKFSDADFPQWKNWKLVDDDTNGDSRCDSAALIGMANGNVAPNAPLDRLNAERQLANATVRARLARTICKFPSEWDASTIDQRWAWLKNKSDDNLQPLSDDDYAKLKAHAQALSFALPDLFAAQWSFNPKDFIQQFRQCAWLSADELDKVYPDTLYPVSALNQIGRTPASIKGRYRAKINQATLKYSIIGPTRRTHFYGQGAIESMFLALMIEGAANFSRNPTHASFASEAAGYYRPASGGYLDYLEGKLGNIEPGDGPKFRGRGMKQLTGRENYSKYWVYRNWLDKDSFHSPWWHPSRPAIAPDIPDPQRLSVDAFNAIDAGGWYWEAGSQANRFRSINSAIENHDFSAAAIERVTRAINGGTNGLPQRTTQTLRIKDVFSDEV